MTLMTITDYADGAVEFFKSGKATDDQWKILGKAVLDASEGESHDTKTIDDEIEKLTGKTVE